MDKIIEIMELQNDLNYRAFRLSTAKDSYYRETQGFFIEYDKLMEKMKEFKEK